MFLSFEGRFTSRLFCTHYQYVSPIEVYRLWLYLKYGALTLDQLSPRVERDRADVSGLVAIVIDLVLIGLIIVTHVGYLI